MLRRPAHALASLLLVGALALGAAACGDDGANDAPSATDTTASSETPDGGSVEQPTEVVGGATTLRLSDTVSKVLDVAGVDIDAAGDATTSGERLRFPIRSGEIDIDTPSGTLEHRGGLRFSAGGRSLEATGLVADLDRERLTAEIAGRRLPLLNLDMGRPQVPPTGDVIMWPASAGISDQAADAINDRLGIDVLRGGLELGDVIISAQRP